MGAEPMMHMHLQRELERLKKNLLYLSAMVEESVEKALRAVERRDDELAHKVIAMDNQVNNLEVDLEEDGLKILALHQPVAIDLRYIVAIVKINSDLERIGDTCVNLAKRALALKSMPAIKPPFNLEEMSTGVRRMLKESLDSLVNVDSQAARKVLSDDDAIDAMHKETYELVKSRVRQNLEELDPLLVYLSVSRHLERIADYAAHIAEDTIYMAEGEIVRHHSG